MARLSRDFFDRDTLTVSRELLGKYLCRRLESGAQNFMPATSPIRSR